MASWRHGLEILERATAAGVHLELDVHQELLWRCDAATPDAELLRLVARHRGALVATLAAQREAAA